MNRYTFVVQIQPDGPSILENLGTHERVSVSDLAEVGPQIEEWVESLKLARPEAKDSHVQGEEPPA